MNLFFILLNINHCDIFNILQTDRNFSRQV